MRYKSTKTLTKCLKGLSKDDLLESKYMDMGVPILLDISKIILGLQYSCDKSGILIQTCVEFCFKLEGMKSRVQGKIFKTPRFKL